jgi:elongation factor G
MVLEPIVNLDVEVPDHCMGDITGGPATKRARINGTDAVARGGEIIIKAQVPLDFSHYEPVPTQVQQKLVEAWKSPHHDED